MENVCMENIQACILVSMLCAGNCEISSEALFIRMGMSMAQIMKLDSVANDQNCPITVSETARLVCWTLYLSSHRCFSGLGLPCRSDEYRPTCELPMDELAFASLNPDQARLEIPRKPGLWAHTVTLVQLSGPVMQLNRRISERPVAPEELDITVRRIEEQLRGWLDSLPADTQMTVPNLHRHQQDGLGGLFVALHLTFHYYSILLYFSFLEEGQGEAPTSSSTGGGDCPYIDRCKHQASSFGGILHLSRQLDGCLVSYPGFSHMITVSSAVLLHTLLLGDAGEIRDARRNLNANFEALVELQQPWPATTAVIGRLMKFQRTCLLSTESHKLDGWMVRFLLDHAVGLEERYSASGSSHQAVEDYEETSKTRELRQSGRYTDFDAL
ncbi:hypothetical protein N8I77_002716 [Diaporthe amygdali]|uniref:Transcription factor domain-containing protein n=1 Tax=Phomopsis amygdali TaxID=1214568 RepID=A0AAD9STB7_PHOAM|nr:hypothetical protein N8I77_002716 [Diaporthe amygdali]